jgi:glycerol-3-phosphate dehydrogenase
MGYEEFDILVIGGGITGAGIALDAATRGLKVALVEKRDFASGTSSRSTKLIHGGLRYLEHFDFSLVREGLQERAIVLKNAPHLAHPFPFLVPIYRDPKRNYDHPLKVRTGLFLYDLLAGRRKLVRHKKISTQEALGLAPQLDKNGLRGAFVYYDGLTNDSRLVAEVLCTAHNHGAAIANYARVTEFTKTATGQISGAQLVSELSGRKFQAQARVVINATGVWVDETRKLTRDGSAVEVDSRHLRPSKGVHLVISSERLKVSTALLVPSLRDHRFYFVVPWEGSVIIGTTDSDYSGDLNAPKTESTEADEILDAVNRFFPKVKLSISDVISTFAGLRPLINNGPENSPKDVSRGEAIFESRDGLISIAGGKLTTYRRMAERTVDFAVKRLAEKRGETTVSGSKTTRTILSGGSYTQADNQQAIRRLIEYKKLSVHIATRLMQTYGSNIEQIETILSENNSLYSSIIPGTDFIAAEIIYAVRFQMAITIADVLMRRTRLALITGKKSFEFVPFVAELMSPEIGWDAAEQSRQVERYRDEFDSEYSAPA